MAPATTRSNRLAILFLLATLVFLGLELWGIRASITALLLSR